MKRIKKKISLLLLLIIVIGVSFYLVSSHSPDPTHPTGANPEWGHAESICDKIADHLNGWYMRSEFAMTADPNKDFVSHLLGNVGADYSRIPVEEPYASTFDFGLYLMLPRKITWPNPTLLAYTTRIPMDSSTYEMRIAFFSSGQNITAVSLRNFVFERIVATETLKDASPNVYYSRFGEVAARENRRAKQK